MARGDDEMATMVARVNSTHGGYDSDHGQNVDHAALLSSLVLAVGDAGVCNESAGLAFNETFARYAHGDCAEQRDVEGLRAMLKGTHEAALDALSGDTANSDAKLTVCLVNLCLTAQSALTGNWTSSCQNGSRGLQAQSESNVCSILRDEESTKDELLSYVLGERTSVSLCAGTAMLKEASEKTDEELMQMLVGARVHMRHWATCWVLPMLFDGQRQFAGTRFAETLFGGGAGAYGDRNIAAHALGAGPTMASLQRLQHGVCVLGAAFQVAAWEELLEADARSGAPRRPMHEALAGLTKHALWKMGDRLVSKVGEGLWAEVRARGGQKRWRGGARKGERAAPLRKQQTDVVVLMERVCAWVDSALHDPVRCDSNRLAALERAMRARVFAAGRLSPATRAHWKEYTRLLGGRKEVGLWTAVDFLSGAAAAVAGVCVPAPV
jgi:hypothetical protein